MIELCVIKKDGKYVITTTDVRDKWEDEIQSKAMGMFRTLQEQRGMAEQQQAMNNPWAYHQQMTGQYSVFGRQI